MGDLDIALRYAATRSAADIAAVPLRDAGEALSLRWLDSQVVRAERRADKGCLLEYPTRRKLLQVEWFASPEAELGWRTYEYQYLLLEHVRQEDEAAAERARKLDPKAKVVAPKPVSATSLIVLLSGPEGDTSTSGRYPISAPEEEFAGARWVVDRVYQRTSRELAERAGAFWLVFSPLAADATAATVTEAVRAAKERASSVEHFSALASTMTALAGFAPERDVFLEVIMGQLSENLLRNNPLFERFAREGRNEGRNEGLKEGLQEGLVAGTLTALHHSLILVLQGRGLHVTKVQRARIEATDDQATLEMWLRVAGTAATTGEVLRHGPVTAKAARKSR